MQDVADKQHFPGFPGKLVELLALLFGQGQRFLHIDMLFCQQGVFDHGVMHRRGSGDHQGIDVRPGQDVREGIRNLDFRVILLMRLTDFV